MCGKRPTSDEGQRWIKDDNCCILDPLLIISDFWNEETVIIWIGKKRLGREDLSFGRKEVQIGRESKIFKSLFINVWKRIELLNKKDSLEKKIKER